MTVYSSFTVKPMGIPSGAAYKIKFYDVSTSSVEDIAAYSWAFGDWMVFTNTYPTNPTYLYITNASTYFSVDECVVFKSGGTIPPPIVVLPAWYYVKTVTATYITISSTVGGAAISLTGTGSGTNYIAHGAGSAGGSMANPTFTYHPTSTTSATYSVYHNVYGSSGSWGTPVEEHVPYVLGTASQTYKPTDEVYTRTSVFLYNGNNATLINRNQTTNNNLLFTKLTCTGSINRAGTATITILDVGESTVTEQDLISNGYTTETNVAIMVGYDIVWSGKILRATQNKMSQFDDANIIKEWNLECESDISKMNKQNITIDGTYYTHVGQLAFVCNNGVSGDIQWINAWKSIISNDGPKIKYYFPPDSKDMYATFQSLAKLSGFDWRTRLETRRYTTACTFDGTDTFTASTFNVATNALIGQWVIVINPTGESPLSYGRVTSNVVLPTGTITCTTITNAGVIPTGGLVVPILVVGDPYLDFASDISEHSPIVLYTMNQSENASLYNGYEFNDKTDKKSLFTKVVVSAKNLLASTTSGLPATISVTMCAKDAWNSDYDMFMNSSYIAHKMDGYVYSYTIGNSYIDLIGADYTLANGDTFYLYRSKADGTWDKTGPFTINGATATYMGSDGVPYTRVTATVVIDASVAAQKYTCFISTKQYVNWYPDLNEGGTYTTVQMGNEIRRFKNSMCGNSATYGHYIQIESASDMGYSSTIPYPHTVGCLLQNSANPITSPETGSPIADYGILQKSVTVDTLSTLTDLDVYATQHLILDSYYYKRASFWCHPYDFSPQDIPRANSTGTYPEYNVTPRFMREGSRISVQAHTGGSVEEYQIVDWTYTANELRIDITLGDFDRNIFTLLGEKTNALTGSIT